MFVYEDVVYQAAQPPAVHLYNPHIVAYLPLLDHMGHDITAPSLQTSVGQRLKAQFVAVVRRSLGEKSEKHN